MKKITNKINTLLRENKRLKRLTLSMLIVFGGIISFNLVKQFMIYRFFAHYEPAPVSIATVKAMRRAWYPEIESVGEFTASEGIEVNAQASGNVVKIYFRSGQNIEAGQALVDIDDTVEQAMLKFYQAQLNLQTINYKRMLDLLKRNVAAVSTVDESKANLDQARSNVEKTEAQIQYKHIVAPFTGKLGIRQVSIGQYVNAGQTPLVSLQAQDPLYLQFYVPEQLYQRLYVGQPLTFTVEAFPNRLFTASIDALNSKVDQKTHNLLVRAKLANCPNEALKNPSHPPLVTLEKQASRSREVTICNPKLNTANNVTNFAFLPGMFAAIHVEEPSVSQVITVPTTAISYGLYGNSVFLIENDTSGKKDEAGNPLLRAKRVYITTGEQQNNDTVILSGLKEGDIVASSGELKLQSGSRVVINNTVPLDATVVPEKLGP